MQSMKYDKDKNRDNTAVTCHWQFYGIT